ncbi:type II toxin-antitoxin system RelE/ParE family toxin [Lactococcus termiticola]|uniref:Uncharacterized protein n=1 Tax=Lactococcus termiticola TaxID=2169526 RepID=A0A2R5HJT1_9LACT|nr:type II toxin-antitoxin system RelE/ParE family toxin [Lactococcus termiticola]GBG96621.1 hypothetical protein NtB2_00745 [Lactococcus termiticola]
MTEVKVLPKAQEQLKNIRFYLRFTLQNPQAEKNLLTALYDKMKLLAQRPESYPLLTDLIPGIDTEGVDFRRLLVSSYVILYHYDEVRDMVFIQHIIHQKQDYTLLF